ncbi:MAG: nicotinate-nucleotide--dimethylbenzimidazole phosphoribosyltransferase [Firmicutes bacterium]|nr:nicotinate-nucleotide--dimethylbenzimidazole phosphoribosyltransferase [Bacillota bacterium]
MLKQYISLISPADEEAATECRVRWDSLAKPLHSLGLLEDIICKIAAVRGSADVALKKRAVAVFCADNGVVARGVSQSGPEVTATVAREMAAGRGNINALARFARADVFPFDVGMAEDAPTVPAHKSAHGTADFTVGPAMSREQAEDAVCFGIEVAERLKDRGYDVLIGGEMGIGNTTTSTALACVLLGCAPATLTGRGAGLSDAALIRKTRAIEQAIAVNAPDPEDPLDLRASLGGFDIAAITGLFLGGAACHVPVIVDGVIAAVAAVLACRLAPACADFMLASHVSREPAHELLLDLIGLAPAIRGDMALGEGSGGVMLLPLLDAALAVYDQGSTFSSFGMEAYTPQEEPK